MAGQDSLGFFSQLRITNLSQVPEPGEDVVLKDPGGGADMILQSKVFVQID